MSGILGSIKTLLGIPVDETSFDDQLVILINSNLSILSQIIYGPDVVFQITTTYGDIDDFIHSNEAVAALAQTYLLHKVRLSFDPPASSTVLAALKEIIAEEEWRLSDYTIT